MKIEIGESTQTFSKDQLILPEITIPQEVSRILKRAEKAGIGVFEPYRFSNITLNQSSNIEGWNSKLEDWYWKKIRNGELNQDAATLPYYWLLVDKTQKPNYKSGKQVYEKDPFGPLLGQLRRDKRIQNIEVKGMPETSRFGTSKNELTQVVFPEIAKLAEVEEKISQVRALTAKEFNIIGNIRHPEWGRTNTREWLEDKLKDGHHLVGGDSDQGGLSQVSPAWPDSHYAAIGFRPVIVISSKI